MNTQFTNRNTKLVALSTYFILAAITGCSDSSDPTNLSNPAPTPTPSMGSPSPPQMVDEESPVSSEQLELLPKSEIIWPLCGRIAENSPQGWTLGDDCPEDRHTAAFDDSPLGTSFGPRLLPRNGDYRYDFHRGLDIPTKINSPLFAVAAGVVIKAGNHPSFTDGVIEVRHYDPDTDDCDVKRCISSFYLHISSHSVQIGDQVTQGQMIGLSGASFTGYEHLHFEIRKAPGSHDRFSNWQRDSQHPFAFLDYKDTKTANIDLSITQVDRSNPMAPIVSVNVRQKRSVEFDLNRIEVEIRQIQLNDEPVLINQSNYLMDGNTPENTPYDVNPPFFDMQRLNRQYTFKDSQTYPWSAFGTGGLYQSPYHQELTATYDPGVHLDNQLPTDTRKGEFNGFTISPTPFSTTSSEDYSLTITFNKLTGTSNAEELCVRARAIDTLNNVSPWVEDGCDSAVDE